MLLREAVPDDVPAIVALVESAYRGDSSRAGWTTEADLLDGQRTDAEAVGGQIATEGSVMLLALDPELVACCHLEHRGDHAYFGMFAVDPRRQAGGIGRQLLTAAESYVVETWGVSDLRMTVLAQRAELIAWYERRGYAATGEVQPWPHAGDERFGRPLAELSFVGLRKPLTG